MKVNKDITGWTKKLTICRLCELRFSFAATAAALATLDLEPTKRCSLALTLLRSRHAMVGFFLAMAAKAQRADRIGVWRSSKFGWGCYCCWCTHARTPRIPKSSFWRDTNYYSQTWSELRYDKRKMTTEFVSCCRLKIRKGDRRPEMKESAPVLVGEVEKSDDRQQRCWLDG